MSMLDSMRRFVGMPTAAAATTQLGRVEANTLSILTIERNAATQAQLNHAEALAAIKQCRDVLMMAISGLQLLVSSDGADDRQKLVEIKTLLDKIDQEVNGSLPPPNPPAKAESDFGPPVYRRGVRVVKYDLKNDWVVGPITIVVKDDEGNVVPAPDGVSFASSVDDASALNVVDNDGMHFTMNALKLRGAVMITHHDTSGQVPDYTDTVNIVEDFTPASADSDFSDAPHTTQPLPAA